MLGCLLFFVRCKKELSCESCADNPLADRPPVVACAGQVNVQANTLTVACDGSVRQLVCAELVPSGGAISFTGNVKATAVGNKIVFAGAYARYTYPVPLYTQVEILDVVTQTWSVHQLSGPRAYGASAVLGPTIYLAAADNSGSASFPVDAYNTASGAWSTINLPHKPGRHQVRAAAAAGNKVLFVSGAENLAVAPFFNYTIVDLYDVVTGQWRTDTLHQRSETWAVTTIPDDGMAATVIGSKVYIAGNASDWNSWMFGTVSADIDIYDATTDTWTTDALRDPRGFMAAIAVGNKNYWAGGIKSWWNSGASEIEQTCTDVVEIRDMTTGAATYGCLSRKRAFLSAVQKDQMIIFFTGQGCSASGVSNLGANTFDIYDITTNTWSIGVLPSVIYGNIVSVNNTIYVAGAIINGSASYEVWKLDF